VTIRDEAVYIEVDDDRIFGTLVAPETLVPGVLFVHGWGGSQRQYVERAREVAALGCVCQTIDLRGHVGTKARYEIVSREDNLRDVAAAYTLLAGQRGVNPAQIAVVGSSYGAYLGAILSATVPVKWLALRAPALYKDTDWQLPKMQLRSRQDLDRYRREVVRPEQSRALRACGEFAGDVLIVESEHDPVVPHQVIENYRNACVHARSLSCRVLTGADHGLSDDASQRAYTRVLVGWLTEMIGAASTATDAAAGEAAATGGSGAVDR
jgi:pimeloyl-ACP methyl ester carboxylesterase